MTTAISATAGSAGRSARVWPLNVNRFRRRDRLSGAESDALGRQAARLALAICVPGLATAITSQ
jgi:hypothetical protein